MNKCYLLPFFTFLLFVFAACEGGTTTANSPAQLTDTNTSSLAQPAPAPETKASAPSIEDLEQKSQVMGFSNFNDQIGQARENGEDWTASPLTVALRFVGPEMNSRKKSVEVESLSGGEVFDRVLIVITEDGFLDDSVQGSKAIIRMEQQNGFWQISSAKKVWKCWENRGHTDYSSDPCG